MVGATGDQYDRRDHGLRVGADGATLLNDTEEVAGVAAPHRASVLWCP